MYLSFLQQGKALHVCFVFYLPCLTLLLISPLSQWGAPRIPAGVPDWSQRSHLLRR